MKKLTLLLAFALGSGAAQAATIFDCKITSRPAGGYVTDRYFFEYDTNAGTVLVFDGLIKQALGRPISGTVSLDNGAQTAFSWPVLYTNTSGQHAKFAFRGTYFKADHTVLVTAVVGGGEYRGSWEGRGTCSLK